MISARTLVNSISLSRVGLALVFVICFQRYAVLLDLAVAMCMIALVSDLLDGYFARKLNVASVHGRLWDSLGDKTFYIAAIIAFNAQGFLDPLLSWALITREVALYITRILYIENLPKIEQTRPFTNWHGYFMYLTIILGLFRMYVEIRGLSFTIYPFMQVSAGTALVFGIASMVHYLKLR
jgi:phosphatidylglycerophosphate synthase